MIIIIINNEIAERPVQLAGARAAGRSAEGPGSPWLARSGLDWLDLAAQGAQLERPGRPATRRPARPGCQRSRWAPCNARPARFGC